MKPYLLSDEMTVISNEAPPRAKSNSLMPPPAAETRKVQSIDPATGEVWREYVSASADEVHAVVAEARAAQKSWAALSFRERGAGLEKFRQLLVEQRLEVARLITRENGRPVAEALVTEVMVVLDVVRYYLTHGEKLLRPRKIPHSNLALKLKRGVLVHEPRGVVGIISPWNYPFMLALGGTVPALLAGNAVVLKPSEFTPTVALKIAEMLTAAGIPDGVFSVVVGDGATGAALSQSAVDHVIFTGSVVTGRKVALAAAERLIPATLELGGSDAMIVLQDAHLENAASAAVWARFMNSGQSCVAIKRIFVEAPIFEAFTEKLVAKVKQLRLGRGEDPDTDVGPMIRERQVTILEAQLEDARARGAKILCGGRRRLDLGPCFFEPTVMVEVNPQMQVMCEETFGPLLPLVPVHDAEQAVQFANDSELGLSASIWTSDIRRGRQLAARIEAGAVLINDVMSHMGNCDAPHGGFKLSGLGKAFGPEGLLDVVRVKYLDSDAWQMIKKPWWFHYTRQLCDNLESFLVLTHGRSWLARLKSIPGVIALLRGRGKI